MENVERDRLLRVHAIERFSRANGPGLRTVIWVQGCSLDCPGCYNPAAQAKDGGRLVTIGELMEGIWEAETRIEGISVSGGEPLEHVGPVLALLEGVREQTELSALLFTGFTWEEMEKLAEFEALLQCLDVVIAGRYDETQRIAEGLVGSANQTVHLLTDRYTIGDIRAVPQAEVVIGGDGSVVMSGIDPLGALGPAKGRRPATTTAKGGPDTSAPLPHDKGSSDGGELFDIRGGR